jgi:hypothetical protein
MIGMTLNCLYNKCLNLQNLCNVRVHSMFVCVVIGRMIGMTLNSLYNKMFESTKSL